MSNRDKLKQLKQDHGLTRQKIADLASVSLHAVNAWLTPETSKSSRKCPDNVIELLTLKLK